VTHGMVPSRPQLGCRLPGNAFSRTTAGWRGPTSRGKNGRPGTTGPDLRGDEYSSPSVPFGLTDSWAVPSCTRPSVGRPPMKCTLARASTFQQSWRPPRRLRWRLASMPTGRCRARTTSGRPSAPTGTSARRPEAGGNGIGSNQRGVDSRPARHCFESPRNTGQQSIPVPGPKLAS